LGFIEEICYFWHLVHRGRRLIKFSMDSVLIIDDDVKLGCMLREFLRRREIQLDIRHNGELGLEAVSKGNPGLILLDVMLPDMDGFEVLQRLRVYSEQPVMLLTARGRKADRIRGLELGADDYLPKPFDPDELVARIKAILRRCTQHSAMVPAQDRRICLGSLVLDLNSRTAMYKDVPLELTDIEFSLLEAFIQSAGAVLSREELAIRLFGRPFHPLNRNLDMHTCRLRKKLHSAAISGNPIKTVRNSGYLFSSTNL